jgi:hypothetical protein
MRYIIQSILLLLAVSLAVSLTEGTLLENVKPGNVNVELGDGYEMSFNLPDIIKSYDIETGSTFNEFLKNKNYYADIKEAGKDDSLLTIGLRIYSEPHLFAALGPSRDEIARMFASVTTPVQIDGEKGHTVYNYPSGNPRTNPLESMGGAFTYYPKSKPDGEDLRCIYEVYADTLGAASKDSRIMPIFQAIMNSIHVSGI